MARRKYKHKHPVDESLIVIAITRQSVVHVDVDVSTRVVESLIVLSIKGGSDEHVEGVVGTKIRVDQMRIIPEI